VIVVTGAGGQLGTAFRKLIPDAVFLTRAELDLSHPEGMHQKLNEIRPDTVINCAAYTAVDRAEEEIGLARVVNGVAVGELARWAEDKGSRLVTFSTDYVFPGTGTKPYVESDPTAPVNAYGWSKLEGEEAALTHPRVLVVRTSWVVSATHPNFVATMIRNARERVLRVVNDQKGCPTIADDLAKATIDALEAGAMGLLHITNLGETTWFELAREAVKLAGLDPALITPIETADYPTPARRPAYSVLGSERLDQFGIDPLPPWRQSLPTVVEGLIGAGLA
jgi:dTDP-4-dehydrorhamnose reductase